MKRIIYTVVVSALFLAMLTGTKKKQPPPPKHAPVPHRQVPETTGWSKNEMHGITFLTPPHAVVKETGYLEITLQSGAIITAAPQTVDFGQIRNEYKQYGEYLYGMLLDDPDAIVPLVWEDKEAHCEVTACHGGWCMVRARYYLMNFDDCMQAVAIIRSIQ